MFPTEPAKSIFIYLVFLPHVDIPTDLYEIGVDRKSAIRSPKANKVMGMGVQIDKLIATGYINKFVVFLFT